MFAFHKAQSVRCNSQLAPIGLGRVSAARPGPRSCLRAGGGEGSGALRVSLVSPRSQPGLAVGSDKTGFKLMVTLQSGCVIEILTLCRMNKIFFQKYHEKAEIHSFPTMYIKGGLPLIEVSQNEDFLQKTA